MRETDLGMVCPSPGLDAYLYAYQESGDLHYLLPLQGCQISLDALCNACGIPNRVCAMRHPFVRWRIGLTVLLEKISSNNFIHKLRAIFLFKTNFNWINIIIFARHMIGSAPEQNLIPGKCFSKKGSNCIDAVMNKIFICDELRICRS